MSGGSVLNGLVFIVNNQFAGTPGDPVVVAAFFVHMTMICGLTVEDASSCRWHVLHVRHAGRHGSSKVQDSKTEGWGGIFEAVVVVIQTSHSCWRDMDPRKATFFCFESRGCLQGLGGPSRTAGEGT